MTTSLRRLLDEEAQRTKRSPAPLDDILSGGVSVVRRRRVVGIAIAAAVALIAVAVPWAIVAGSDTDQPIDEPRCELPLLLGSGYDRAPTGVSVASLDLTDVREFLPQADAGGDVGVYPAFSPDGKRIAYVDYVEETAGAMVRSAMVVVDVESGRRHRVTGDETRVGAPAWSPDGDRIAYTSTRYVPYGPGWQPDELHIVNVDGTADRTVELASGDADIGRARWAEDHALFYVAEGVVWRIDPDAPQPVTPERVARLDAWDEDSEVLISPHGSAVVMSVKVKDTTHLELVDLASGRNQPIAESETSDHGTTTPLGWTSDGVLVFDRDPGDAEHYEVWSVSEDGSGEATRIVTVDEDSVEPHLYAVSPACPLPG